MLFRKDIEPSCAYCESGVSIGDGQVACLRRGIVNAGGQCGKFRYDPLKREPPRSVPLEADKFSQEDFSLE